MLSVVILQCKYEPFKLEGKLLESIHTSNDIVFVRYDLFTAKGKKKSNDRDLYQCNTAVYTSASYNVNFHFSQPPSEGKNMSEF